jgi:hypothetical protein
VIVAVLHAHTPVAELRVFYEPETLDTVLAREFGPEPTLVRHAAFVRDELVRQGWIQLGASGAPHRFGSTYGTRVVAGVSLLAIVAVWSSRWRRRHRTPEVNGGRLLERLGTIADRFRAAP